MSRWSRNLTYLRWKSRWPLGFLTFLSRISLPLTIFPMLTAVLATTNFFLHFFNKIFGLGCSYRHIERVYFTLTFLALALHFLFLLVLAWLERWRLLGFLLVGNLHQARFKIKFFRDLSDVIYLFWLTLVVRFQLYCAMIYILMLFGISLWRLFGFIFTFLLTWATLEYWTLNTVICFWRIFLAFWDQLWCRIRSKLCLFLLAL